MRRFRHFIIVIILLVVSTVALYAVLSAIFVPPVAASTQALSIDGMFSFHFAAISFLFSLIMVIMLYSVFAFRRKEGDESAGRYMHGNTALEVGWTVVPTIAVIGVGIWAAIVLNNITSPQPDELGIEVTARQWVWSFAYPENGDFPAAEMVLPVDRPVVLSMRSQDVLHDFWVPEFRVKQDLVPGQATTLRFTPTRMGDYVVRCAELCGLNHTNMRAPVRVVSEEEFLAWVEERNQQPVFAELSPAERGAIWHGVEFGFGCGGCHSIDGTPGAGPTWFGIMGNQEQMTDGSAVTVDRDYILNSIMNPNDKIVDGFQPNIMPTNFQELFAAKEAELLATEGVEIDIVDDLVAFISTLQE